MKVLTTSSNPQELKVIPRSYPSLITVKVRNESTNGVDTYTDVSTTQDKGYLVFSEAYSLEEAFSYELTILDGSTVIYKDKIFCTNQDIADYSVNVDTETWDTTLAIWNTTENGWDTEGIVDIYETEDTYDNDYIII
jgi:hypothetical protein